MNYYPDYQRETFDPVLSVSWGHLTILQILLLALVAMISMWKLSEAIQTKKRIIYVEVLNKNEKIDRQTSKQNLNIVVDTFIKKRKFSLFDKFWYLKRAENHEMMDYRGVHIDGIQCVEMDLEGYVMKKDWKGKSVTAAPDLLDPTKKTDKENESVRYHSAEVLDAYDGSEDGNFGGK